MRTKDLNLDYEKIEEDYRINGDEDDRMYNLKKSLEILTPVEKKILLTYCELGSYAAVAKAFNVSAPTAKSYINNVRQKIMYRL